MNFSGNVMLIGGPGSGKSNYLFRIWLAIERETGRLIKDGMPDDLVYLSTGAAQLLDGKFAPHTSRDTQHTSKIPVLLRTNPVERSLLIAPDASGEIWLKLFNDRAWPQLWDDLISESTGLILMIRVNSPLNIQALDWITAEHFHGMKHKNASTGTPTEVMLVDWLQIMLFIAERKADRRCHMRLSVVITAWDELPDDKKQAGPMQYLQINFPLLGQFIDTGAGGLDARVFGLSLLGGNLSDTVFMKQVQQADASKLGYVVSHENRESIESKDVLEPVYWALGLDG
jgi:hypothetical protein